jgi:hypothetical protein
VVSKGIKFEEKREIEERISQGLEAVTLEALENNSKAPK